MKRFAYLLGVWLLAVLVTTAGCNISGQPCGWLNLSACNQSPQLPMCDEMGAGGEGGAGGSVAADCGMQDDYCVQDSDCCQPGGVCSLNACQISGNVRRIPLDSPGCLATLPMVAPNWQGLTTTQLRWIANQNNINGCATQTGITQSRTIGVAFETWVLKTRKQNNPRWTTPIPSAARAKNTNGLPASVIPEYVDDQVKVTLTTAAPLTVTWDYFPKSMFYEVKAKNGTLTPGTSQWQILGLLDVATSFPTAPTTAHAPPLVFFTTTSNTTVSTKGTSTSPGVVAQATTWGVAVWQQIVEYDANSSTPNNPNLRLGPTTCLNDSVYQNVPAVDLTWVDPLAGWPVNPLTWPTDQERDDTDLGSLDPDSPAVDGP